MSKSIDERVVEMQFDNKNFESNVQTSMGTLEKLKEALKFDGASKGIEEVGKAAKDCDVSPMGSAVETVKEKFSALEVFAITAMANIANSVVNAGKRMIDEFTLAPIRDGFAEYELKMGSVQTIMASTGASVETVNKYLNDLNTYSDKTIYSFKDMTASIGKFTNAGVSLDDAVNAIKGISNEAAVSGANANEASRAMYNFAQALSAGSVKLIDWKSIENANMATVEFKQELMDTAVAMGTLVKEGDSYVSTTTDMQGKTSAAFNSTRAFNESLSSQWMTTEVLVEALQHYSTDVRELSAEELKAYESKLRANGYTEEQIKKIEELGTKAADAATEVKTFSQLIDTVKEGIGSGWAQTFETLFGNIEEAKVLWTGINNVIDSFVGESSRARNELLQAWADVGGRVNLINSLKNVFNGLVSVISPIAKSIGELFPPITAARLSTLTFHLLKFTENMRLSQSAMDGLRNVVKIILTPLKILLGVIGKVASLFAKIVPIVGSFADSFLSLFSTTAQFSDATENFVFQIQRLRVIQAIQKIIENFKIAIQDAKERFSEFIKEFKNTEAGQKFFESFSKLSESLKSLSTKAMKLLADGLVKLSKIDFRLPDMSGFSNGIGGAAEAIANFLSQFLSNGFSAFGKFGDILSGSKKELGGFKDGVSSVKDGVIKVLGEIKDAIFSAFVPSDETIKKASDGYGGLIDSFSEKIKKAGGIERVIGGVLTTGLFGAINFEVFKFIKGFNKSKSSILDSIEDMFTNIAKIFSSVSGVLDAFSARIKADVVKTIAISIGILAGSLFLLSTIPSEKLTSALIALGVVSGGLLAFTFAMTKIVESTKGAGMLKTAVSLVALSSAILILSGVVKKLSGLSWGELAKGLAGVAGLCLVVSLTAKSMSGNTSGMLKASVFMLSFGVAIGLISKAIEKLGNMDMGQLEQGLIGVGSALLAVKLFVEKTDFGSLKISSAVGLILLATALNMLVLPVVALGNMDFGEMVKGLVGVFGIMAAISKLSNSMGDSSAKMISAGAGMILIAGALNLLIIPITALGSLNVETLIKGLVSVAALVAGIVVLSNNMEGSSAKLITFGVGMTVIAGALNLLAIPVTVLGGLNLTTLAKGLGSIAAVLAGVVIVTHTIGSSSGQMILAGIGMTSMAVALNLLVTPISVLGSLSLPTLAKGIIAMVAALYGLAFVGQIAQGSAIGLLSLSASLISLSMSVVLFAAGFTGIAAGINLIVMALLTLSTISGEAATRIVTAIQIIFVGLLELIPNLIIVIGECIAAIAEAIIIAAPAIANAIFTVLSEIVNLIAKSIPTILNGILQTFTSVLSLIDTYLPVIVDKVLSIITNILIGLSSKIGDIVVAGADLCINFMNGVSQKLPEIIDSGVKLAISFINGLADGIRNNGDMMISAVGNLITAVIGLLVKAIPKFIKGGIDLIVALAKGIAQKAKEAVDAAWKIITGCVDKIKEGVKEFKDAAIECVTGFIKGIKEKINAAVEAVGNLGSKVVGGLKNVLGIESPSKEFAEVGRLSDLGLVNGLIDNAKFVEDASKRVGSSVLDSMRSALKDASDVASSEMNLNPTIRPVVDLDELRTGISQVNDAFANDFDISTSLNNARAAVVSRTVTPVTENKTPDQQKPTTYNFTQNNYSPKSLSRMEIYRQTKNQFSAMKGAVAAT